MTNNVINIADRSHRRRAPRPGVGTATAIPIQRAAYTVAEVAQLLGLSTSSTYVMVRAGEIPARRMGGRWIIPRRRFHVWLDELPEDDGSDDIEAGDR